MKEIVTSTSYCRAMRLFVTSLLCYFSIKLKFLGLVIEPLGKIGYYNKKSLFIK
jgi:hypothetical protein